MKTILENALAQIVYYSGLIKHLRNKGQRYPKIVLFHSVSNRCNEFVKGPSDTWISDSQFIKHIDFLRKYYHLISLKELSDGLKRRMIPARSVVITFDDGFSDNYYFAFPILRKHSIPATIFLTTDSIDNKKILWVQQLNYLINHIGADNLIEQIKNFKTYPQFGQLLNGFNSIKPFHKKFENFLAYEITKHDREKILSKLFDDFNISLQNIITRDNVFLSWEQIKIMRAHGIYFGNHGESHTPFSSMSENEQRAEIENSKNHIENHIKQDFMTFAYPFGQSNDFTKLTTQILNASGYECILTAMPTSIHKNSSHLELGRIVVGNVPVYRLAYELEKSVLKSWIRNR